MAKAQEHGSQATARHWVGQLDAIVGCHQDTQEGITMRSDQVEHLLYGGESPRNRIAYLQYLREVQRGKSLLQLKAVAAAITPEIRQSWSARSFTPVQTSDGVFDEVICNISYHFHKHGQKYGTIQKMTEAALQAFSLHRSQAKLRTTDGLLALPDGSLYEPGGQIVTFVG